MSHSLIALISLHDHYSSNELVLFTQELFAKVRNKISFMLIPSHIGIPGNEKADAMAYEVISSLTITIYKISSKDMINQDQNLISTTWENLWNSVLEL